MLNERNLWLGATTAVVCILLILIFQAPPERRERATPAYLTDLGVIVSTDGGQTWRVALR